MVSCPPTGSIVVPIITSLYILQLMATAIGTGGVVTVSQPWKKGKYDYDYPLWVEYDTHDVRTKMLLGYGLAVLAGMWVGQQEIRPSVCKNRQYG